MIKPYIRSYTDKELEALGKLYEIWEKGGKESLLKYFQEKGKRDDQPAEPSQSPTCE
jgi:hypothetical protein